MPYHPVITSNLSEETWESQATGACLCTCGTGTAAAAATATSATKTAAPKATAAKPTAATPATKTTATKTTATATTTAAAAAATLATVPAVSTRRSRSKLPSFRPLVIHQCNHSINQLDMHRGSPLCAATELSMRLIDLCLEECVQLLPQPNHELRNVHLQHQPAEVSFTEETRERG